MDTPTPSLDALKQADRSLYSAILYAPVHSREAIATLHLFERETARVRDLISEPLPGEIRLQWWRDVIEGERGGEAAAHPLASCLLKVIDQYGLSQQSLAQLTQARIFDVYDDSMPTLNDLEGYCGETWSTIFQASAQVLGNGTPPPTGDAAGHAGVAYGISLTASRAGVHRARGQVYVPDDLLRATGGDRDAWLYGDDGDYRARALLAFVEFAQEHEMKAKKAIKALAATYKPAFMPIALARPVLRAVTKKPKAIFSAPLPDQPLQKQFALISMALRG